MSASQQQISFRELNPSHSAINVKVLPSTSGAVQSLKIPYSSHPSSSQPLHTTTVSTPTSVSTNLQWPSCSMCFGSPVRVVFLPCLHHVTCEPCSYIAMQRNRLCPLCRREISSCITPRYT